MSKTQDLARLLNDYENCEAEYYLNLKQKLLEGLELPLKVLNYRKKFQE